MFQSVLKLDCFNRLRSIHFRESLKLCSSEELNYYFTLGIQKLTREGRNFKAGWVSEIFSRIRISLRKKTDPTLILKEKNIYVREVRIIFDFITHHLKNFLCLNLLMLAYVLFKMKMLIYPLLQVGSGSVEKSNGSGPSSLF